MKNLKKYELKFSYKEPLSVPFMEYPRNEVLMKIFRKNLNFILFFLRFQFVFLNYPNKIRYNAGFYKYNLLIPRKNQKTSFLLN